MRLSDLLGCDVLDASGASLGEVADVRLAQDGPLLGTVMQALRVDALLVGRSGLAQRLGFVHGGVVRPALLAAGLRAISGRSFLVPWDDVVEWNHTERTVRLHERCEPQRL